MKLNKRNIIFTNDSQISQDFFKPPTPAKLSIPNWYKKSSRMIEGETKAGLNPLRPYTTNTTMKACIPFFDALSCGYIWELPIDLEIRKIDNTVTIRWRDNNTYVDVHTPQEMQKIPSPMQSTNGTVFKWLFPFHIKTPKNYSVLFTHPLNRHDLPFRTFSGIVDTDKYPLDVQFPFQVLTDTFEDLTILDAGTPIIQFMPILRENWEHEVKTYNEKDTNKRSFDFFSKIEKAYQNRYWSKKTYN
jgi:hypothetical protein